LVHVHPDILFLTHKGAPFARLVIRTISTYRKSGRLFILRVIAFLRRPVGVSFFFGFLLNKVFPLRVAAVATLPSALFEE